MTLTQQIFSTLIISGLMLVGAEVFVPGGILGFIGAILLFVAIIIGYNIYGPAVGTIIAGLIIVLVMIVIILWVKFFPKTKIGQQMTVSNNLSESKATETGLNELLNKEGEAVSELRPGGFAKIDGKRVDVVTQGEMIEKGESVRVIEIKGNRVVVRRTENKTK